MSNSVLLCADIGTSSLKAAFINVKDEKKRLAKRLAALIRIAYPKDIYRAVSANDLSGTLRHVKLPSAEWEDAFRRAVCVLRQMAQDAKIEAVCISGNGPTLVPVDSRGEALLTLHWFGKTSVAAGVSSFFLPHVLWFREKYPELFANTAKIFSSQEWFSSRLGAASVSVLPAAGYKPFYWNDEQCAACGIESALFPPFAGLGDIIGGVSGKAARDFDIPEGIPIISGGPDFIMAILGCAAISSGIVCDRAGSSEGINVCVTEDEAKRVASLGTGLRILPHVIDGLWNVSAVLPESGSIFEHWREETLQTNRGYDDILSEIIPNYEINDAHPVLLKIASKVNEALLKLEAAGLDTSVMRVSGGQAKNNRWNILKSKLIGRKLLVPEILDAELAGDAACILKAIGVMPSLADACDSIVRISAVSFS